MNINIIQTTTFIMNYDIQLPTFGIEAMHHKDKMCHIF
jgi:hypothetical protein